MYITQTLQKGTPFTECSQNLRSESERLCQGEISQITKLMYHDSNKKDSKFSAYLAMVAKYKLTQGSTASACFICIGSWQHMLVGSLSFESIKNSTETLRVVLNMHRTYFHLSRQAYIFFLQNFNTTGLEVQFKLLLV